MKRITKKKAPKPRKKCTPKGHRPKPTARQSPSLPLIAEESVLSPSVTDRFSKHVVITGPDQCWSWKGAKSSRYPRLLCGGRAGRLVPAHRISWEVYFGRIPAGLSVCHRCDNTRCTNPRHLFLGTHLDNMRDREAKGRGKTPLNRGSANPSARLTDDDVREIRRRANDGESLTRIAASKAISVSLASMVASRQRWGHVS